jgi:hypothetical protein
MSAQLKKLLPAGGQAVEKVGTASPQLRIPPEKQELVTNCDRLDRGIHSVVEKNPWKM